jgi:hypothetical protein
MFFSPVMKGPDMEVADFFAKVYDNKDLEGISIDLDSGFVAVHHKPTKICTAIPRAAIEKTDWKTLEEVLVGQRDPEVLYHMTRIVGYYSRVENWNNSKLGEMKARIKGSYGLEGAESAKDNRLEAVDQVQNQ